MRLMFTLLISLMVPALASAAKPIEIRWTVSHDPHEVRYNQMLEKFAARLSERSQGALKLKIIPLRHGGTPDHMIAYRQLMAGETDMGQIFAMLQLNPNFEVFNFPFLFETHDHVTKVVDGKIGRALLGEVLPTTKGKVRAFEFTYSGGFRQIYGVRAVRRPADLRGYRLLVPHSRVVHEYYRSLGVKLVPHEPVTSRATARTMIEQGKIDGDVSEYGRAGTLVEGKVASVVSETNHNVFLTTIVANEKFFQKLPENLRKILSEEVRELALTERDYSIQLEQSARSDLQRKGINVISLSPEDRKLFVESTKGLYEKFSASLGALTREIQELGKSQ